MAGFVSNPPFHFTEYFYSLVSVLFLYVLEDAFKQRSAQKRRINVVSFPLPHVMETPWKKAKDEWGISVRTRAYAFVGQALVQGASTGTEYIAAA